MWSLPWASASPLPLLQLQASPASSRTCPSRSPSPRAGRCGNSPPPAPSPARSGIRGPSPARSTATNSKTNPGRQAFRWRRSRRTIAKGTRPTVSPFATLMKASCPLPTRRSTSARKALAALRSFRAPWCPSRGNRFSIPSRSVRAFSARYRGRCRPEPLRADGQQHLPRL